MHSSDRIGIGFIGFRHAHVRSLYQLAATHPRCRIVAACETHPDTAAAIRAEGKIALTHDSVEALLAESACNIVAIGDVYADRGRIALQALRTGRHVIADKPLCTQLAELDAIAAEAEARRLKVGCLFDLRAGKAFATMRRLIREGVIGEVQTIAVTAQHPLLRSTRPGWYFEPGRHGGTLNDVACHATDLIPWLTGRQIAAVTCARAWNARLPEVPHFQDAAQFMLRLDNDGGVIGDVSYLAPERSGYRSPQYWRVTCHGAGGMIEATNGQPTLLLATSDDTAVREVEVDPGQPIHPLDSFLLELDAQATETSLTTADVLAASRRALILQQAADQQLRNVPC